MINWELSSKIHQLLIDHFTYVLGFVTEIDLIIPLLRNPKKFDFLFYEQLNFF